MSLRQIAVLLILVSITSVAIPGNIYKCKDESGSTVFSGIPCSPDAKKVRIQNHRPSSSNNSGLRPGELKAINDIQQKEIQERARRENKQPAEKTISYSDRQRLETLQKEKSRIMNSKGHRQLSARQRSAALNSIDLEIAAIRGVPVVIQENAWRPNRSSQATKPQLLLDPSSGAMSPRTGAGYTDPSTGTYYNDVAGGVVNTRTGEFIPTR